MNFKTYIFFILVSVLVYGCPGPNNQRELKKLQENKNNFPDLIKQTYDGISFRLSSLFEDDDNSHYVIHENAFTRSIYNLNVYFSLETFNHEEIETIKFSFENEISDTEAVHEYFVYKRVNSISTPFKSVRKELPKINSPKGYIQVIEDVKNDYDGSMTYFISSFKVDEKIYVMQLIGKSGNMDYLYDDFLAILNSVN